VQQIIPTQVELRAALSEDFDYCQRIYFSEMKWIIEELRLDRASQETSFRQQWNLAEVSIIVVDGTDTGWLQTIMEEDALFLGQIFVDRPFQRKGIGTEVMKRLIADANRADKAVRLSVAKINPARGLYERLGFQITHEDDRKLYMTRDPNMRGPTGSP
jgi:ribosomal protein S18 acetylase RimI-like enzyme